MDDGDTLFALLYERLVSGRNRRHLGTFFTPPELVNFLLDRAERLVGVPRIIIDPGAGVGAVTAAAHRRWSDARVYAVDVNVVTLGLLATLCSVQGIEKVEMILADYLTWIGTSLLDCDGPRLIVGNPPYTRYQDLQQKPRTDDSKHDGAWAPSGLAGLSAYFLTASLRALRPQDALCFVLPGSWTETRYGTKLRQLLWEQASRATEFYPFPVDFDAFPGTRVTAMILAVGPLQSKPQPITVAPARMEGAVIHAGPETRIRRSGPTPASFGPWLWSIQHRTTADREKAIELGDLARVRRGVATGANEFFFLGDKERGQLPPSAVVRGLLRLRHVNAQVLNEHVHDAIGLKGARRWLLQLADPDVMTDERVRKLITKGEEAGFHRRYITSKRARWYVVERVSAPDILVGTMGRHRFPVVLNQALVVPSNSIYGIYLDADARSLGPALAEWLNSDEGQLELQAAGRHYAGGLMKIEPNDLLAIRIPAREVLVRRLNAKSATQPAPLPCPAEGQD